MPGLPAGMRASKAGRLTSLVLVIIVFVLVLNYFGSTGNYFGSTETGIQVIQPGKHVKLPPYTITGDETWDNFITTRTHTSTSTTSLSSHTHVPTVDHPAAVISPQIETDSEPELNKTQTHHHASANTPEPKELYDGPPIRATTHQRYLTLSTMFKNQRRWLREWIEFNLMVGVEHFILYDNNSTDLPLEILQPYIDQGLITYIPWPPQVVPPPIVPHSLFEEEQDAWYRDSLDTCLHSNFTIHKQGPCQMAAFIDALRRTKGGVSRWLGIWDVDEYIYPRRRSPYDTIPEFLRGRYPDHSTVQIWGNIFGTSGHSEIPRRKAGDAFPPLMTESYVYRARQDHDDEDDPFVKLGLTEDRVEHGIGKLSTVHFGGGGDDFARKSLADPDTVMFTFVHHFVPLWDAIGDDWKDERVEVGDDDIKFNHYAYLSQGDAHRKAHANHNPYMDFDEEVDEFFSEIYDAEIFYLVPELIRRILRSLQAHPPRHPDDWVPSRVRKGLS